MQQTFWGTDPLLGDSEMSAAKCVFYKQPNLPLPGYTANMSKYFEKDSERIKNDARMTRTTLGDGWMCVTAAWLWAN